MTEIIEYKADKIIVQERAGNYVLAEFKIPLKSLWWLAKETHLDFHHLKKALDIVNQEPPHWVFGVPYNLITRYKPNGEKRYLYEPCEPLKSVQKRINDFLLSPISRHPNTFGFSRGNVSKTLKPHLGSTKILTLDIQGAFPNTDSRKVFEALCQHYSKGVAKIISILATFPIILGESGYTNTALPQGAPTSPRIFDRVFKPIDDKIARLAKNTGIIIYTRYADNLFISTPEDEIPPKIKRAIIRIIKKHGYTPHKIKEQPLEDNTIRALGLNIFNGQLYNTRRSKRQLRLTLHHLKWLTWNPQDPEVKRENLRKAFQIFNGQLSWAIKETLPTKLKEQLKQLSA